MCIDIDFKNIFYLFIFNRRLIVGYPRLIAIKKINRPAALVIMPRSAQTRCIVHSVDRRIRGRDEMHFSLPKISNNFGQKN